jgi:hypothetical protein
MMEKPGNQEEEAADAEVAGATLCIPATYLSPSLRPAVFITKEFEPRRREGREEEAQRAEKKNLCVLSALAVQKALVPAM